MLRSCCLLGLPSEVRGRCETPSYFLFMPLLNYFQLVAPRQTCLCSGVICSANIWFIWCFALKINFLQTSDKLNNLRLSHPHFGLLSASAAVSSFYRCCAVGVYGAIPEIGDSRETLAYSFCSPKLLSPCLRSNPLLVCGQMALRAYNDIGKLLFVQAR